MTDPLGFDPYHVLGVAPDADEIAIQLAHRARIREAHPDRAGASGLERAKRLNIARDWLLDGELRLPDPVDPPSGSERVDIRVDDVTLDFDALESAIGPRTKLVAVGYASNAVGTINPVRSIVEQAHAARALAYVDAVHYAPHGPIDVAALGTDFLVTSAYKWFGPHAGALYGRREVLDRLPAYKVRPAHDRFETGTQNFEGIAGVGAAVEYLRSIGRRAGASGGRRAELVSAMEAIRAYERGLAERMAAGLASIPGVRVWGITDSARFDERTPTFAVTIDGVSPREAATALGRRAINAWDGDFYAQALIERLGLFETGGVLRLGIVHYTTAEEVDRVLEALEAIAVAGRASAPVAVPGAYGGRR